MQSNKLIAEFCTFLNSNPDNITLETIFNLWNNLPLLLQKYPQLEKFKDIIIFLVSNKGEGEKEITLNIDTINDIFSNSLIPKKYIKKYKYREYNKDLVLSYENQLIKNLEYTKSFMSKQLEHIKSLTLKEKLIIRDYTNRAFLLLTEYLNRTNDDFDFLTAFVDKYCEGRGMEIGNTLFHQIREYMLEQYDKDILEEGQDIKSIFDIPVGEYSIPEYIKDLTLEDWSKILETYINDINELILTAPLLEFPIYAFRGSKTDYMVENTTVKTKDAKGKPIEERGFKSARIASYSLDSKHSFYFYDAKLSSSTMYRTLIVPGARVLFLASLSRHPYEMEIITPINQVSVKISERQTINKYTEEILCVTDDKKFASIDIVLLPS